MQHSTKEEDVWEDRHDASLLAWVVVYGGMRCFNNVAQLRAPAGAHLATATDMLRARLEKVPREEGPDWLQFKEQTVIGAWHAVQLVQFDSSGQKCAANPPFRSVGARVVTLTLTLRASRRGTQQLTLGGCRSAECCWTMAVCWLCRLVSVPHMAEGFTAGKCTKIMSTR